jgi:hypothetical protein
MWIFVANEEKRQDAAVELSGEHKDAEEEPTRIKRASIETVSLRS